MLVAYVLPSKIYHASNSIERGLMISLQFQFETTERTKNCNIDKMMMHCDRVKMCFDDPLHDFINFQVSVLIRKWIMGETTGNNFTLEGSEIFFYKNTIKNLY